VLNASVDIGIESIRIAKKATMDKVKVIMHNSCQGARKSQNTPL